MVTVKQPFHETSNVPHTAATELAHLLSLYKEHVN